MSIDITCPSCGHLGHVPNHFANQRVKCRRCATLFTVVDPAAEVETTEVVAASLVDRPVAGNGSSASHVAVRPALLKARGLTEEIALFPDYLQIKRPNPNRTSRFIRLPLLSLEGVKLKSAGLISNGHLLLVLLDSPPRPENAGDPNLILFNRAQQPSFEALQHAAERMIASLREK
jgi:hypothetical protein